MDRWNNKIAVVTGASAGIGRAVAIKLVKHGMKVVACARRDDALKEIAADLNKDGPGEMFPVRCDVSQESDILSMFAFVKGKFGKIHVCINNAGFATLDSIISGSTEGWKGMFDVNVIGMSICTREAVKLMKDAGVDDGHVVNLNSIVGHFVGPRLKAYSATKYAVTALTEGLRQELCQEKSHIRTTSISPGFVKTEFAARTLKSEAQANAIMESMQTLSADDIADAILYALSAPPHVNVNEIIIRPVEQNI